MLHCPSYLRHRLCQENHKCRTVTLVLSFTYEVLSRTCCQSFAEDFVNEGTLLVKVVGNDKVSHFYWFAVYYAENIAGAHYAGG